MNGNTMTATVATNYQSQGAYLTTAAQSNQVVNSLNGSTGQISLNVGSSLSASTNGSSITFGLASNITTALQSAGNYLTTARASNDGIGLNTAQTNVTWTVGSNGLSLNASGYAGTGTTFNGANLSASMTLNSNGLNLSMSANTGGGGAGLTLGNWEIFPAGNNTTFSSMGQNSLYLQKLNPGANYSFNNFELRASGSFVSSTNSQVVAHTIDYGLYSLNANTYSSIATSRMVISASFNSSSAYGITVSQGAGSYTVTSNNTILASFMTGFKHLYLPFTSTLTEGGQYAFGLLISSATTVGTSPLRLAFLNQTIVNNLTIGKIYASTITASNSTFVGDFNMGVQSTTTGAMPSSVNVAALTNQVSQQDCIYNWIKL